MAISYIKLNCTLQNSVAIETKIAQIDLIIESLLNVALIAVGQGDTMEYELDTGQTKISKKYTSPDQVTKAIQDYENIRQMYVNKLVPRNIRLVDSKNLGYYGGR